MTCTGALSSAEQRDLLPLRVGAVQAGGDPAGLTDCYGHYPCREDEVDEGQVRTNGSRSRSERIDHEDALIFLPRMKVFG